jgi:hypothetical protein
VSLLVMPLLFLAFMVMDGPRFPADLPILGITLGSLALIGWLGTGIRGGELRRIVVDAQGLHVGHRLLPAHRIGDCQVVPYRDVLGSIAGRGVDGTRVKRFRHLHSDHLRHDAVFVLERDPGRRRPSGWMVGTRDAQRLAEALERVATASHSPSHDPTAG